MQKKDMELEGALRAFTLPDILQFLSMQKLTGILSIWREGYSIDLTIKDGKVVNSSTLDRARKLGEMLVYRGFMKRVDLLDVLNAQKGLDRGKLLGQILIERELISNNTLKEVLKLQLEEEIWELFSWKDGEFKFEHRKDIDTSNILVEIDIEPLLIEGSRRQDEWSKIIRNIPNDTVVLTVQPLPESFESEMTLSENEWVVLSLVNGFFDVGSIVNRTGLGKFETYRILNTFITAELVKSKPLEKVEQDLMRDSAPTGVVRSLRNVRPQDAASHEGTLFASSPRKGLGAFFSRGKQSREMTSIQLDFISPLGAIGFYVNSLYESLITSEGFAPSKEEGSLLCSMWRKMLMHYPKADMVCISNGRINVKPLEMIIQWENDISKVLQECFEDSFAALTQLTQYLYQMAVERLGDKSATRIAAGILSDFVANIRYKQSRNYELRSWVQEILKI